MLGREAHYISLSSQFFSLECVKIRNDPRKQLVHMAAIFCHIYNYLVNYLDNQSIEINVNRCIYIYIYLL